MEGVAWGDMTGRDSVRRADARYTLHQEQLPKKVPLSDTPSICVVVVFLALTAGYKGGSSCRNLPSGTST